MPQCKYRYHTWTNQIPRRCSKEEGHIGDHVEEQLATFNNLQQGSSLPLVGWIKSG